MACLPPFSDLFCAVARTFGTTCYMGNLLEISYSFNLFILFSISFNIDETPGSFWHCFSMGFSYVFFVFFLILFLFLSLQCSLFLDISHNLNLSFVLPHIGHVICSIFEVFRQFLSILHHVKNAFSGGGFSTFSASFRSIFTYILAYIVCS
jgi:hypothetical protein